MSKDLFRDRERAEEAVYFSQQDAKLIEKLRQQARFAEIAHALAEKLQVDEPALLDHVKKLGVTLDTGAAFILAPLVEVAWANGHVSHAARDAVLRVATRRGVVHGSADHHQLLEWLAHRPSEAIFQAAREAIRVGISVLPPAEAEQRIAAMVKACEEVAQATAGGLAKLLQPSGISDDERAVIAAIRAHLERHGDAAATKTS
jgi:hypothetical protein